MRTDGRPRRVFGVLVTYRRAEQLAVSLDALAHQTLPIEHLVVVDNDPTPETRDLVLATFPRAEYVAAPENLGPAGGIALGMERLLGLASDDDWIATFDDDDPALDPTLYETLVAFGEQMLARDPRLAAVGVEGIRFDRRRGRVQWVPDDELREPVPVDSIGGRNFPTYRASAIRAVGVMREDLFFGFEELEFGLRLRSAGFTLYVPGPIWHARREAQGMLARRYTPSRRLGDLSWRRYYSLRNLVAILRSDRAYLTALRVTLVVGIAKPLVNLVRDPGLSLRHLRLNLLAIRDAWLGHMGRTVEPGR